MNDRDKLDSTRSNIAIITARSGRAEEALELVRRMKSGIMRARPLTAACRTLARNGKTQQALQATAHASSMEERTQALVGVAEGIMDREGRYAVLKTEGF